VYFCVLRLIVVPLPTGKNPFAVQLNNNNKNVSQKRVRGRLEDQTIGRRQNGKVAHALN
jgi:hypothetical protein